MGNVKDVKGDTKEFADKLVHLVESRRKGGKVEKGGVRSVAGSWEVERVELIVDIPVWSPGCFQGMSPLSPLLSSLLSPSLVVFLSTPLRLVDLPADSV